MARYTAVLDACVLVPITLTDTLLRIADRGLGSMSHPASARAKAAAEFGSSMTYPLSPPTLYLIENHDFRFS